MRSTRNPSELGTAQSDNTLGGAVLWVELDAAGKSFERFRNEPLETKSVPEVSIGGGQIRVQLDRAAEALHRSIQVSIQLVGHSQIDVHPRVGRIQSDGGAGPSVCVRSASWATRHPSSRTRGRSAFRCRSCGRPGSPAGR